MIEWKGEPVPGLPLLSDAQYVHAIAIVASLIACGALPRGMPEGSVNFIFIEDVP